LVQRDAGCVRIAFSHFPSSPIRENRSFIRLRESPEPNEIRFFAVLPRALWLLPMNFMEHSFHASLERFVFRSLVEFAHEVPADLEGVVGEVQG
jgi:hypothetical protein